MLNRDERDLVIVLDLKRTEPEYLWGVASVVFAIRY